MLKAKDRFFVRQLLMRKFDIFLTKLSMSGLASYLRYQFVHRKM